VVRGTETSVELPPASVDLVFVCDTYHHFEHPKETLASIRRALRPGGVLMVVDFKREPGKTAAWITEHVRAGQAVVTAEIEAAGFGKPEELPLLKENYVLRFRLRP
jgi:predicted methyltransferase